MICVECGKEEPRLIGGCCPACFVAQTPLLETPHTLDVELCAHCDARHIGNSWVDPDEGVPLEDIRMEAVRQAVRVHQEVRDIQLTFTETPQDERNFSTSVSLKGHVDEVPLQDERRILVRIKRSVCDRCSRMFGGFYAGVIQLRATGRDVTEREKRRADRIMGEELDRMRASGNRESFLSKQEDVLGGVDYFMGDIESSRIIAKLIAHKLNGSVVETAKLVGRREGMDVFRVTFLVRIDLFSDGDFARYQDTLVQVHSIDRGRAHVVDLATGRWDKVDETRLKRLGGPEILDEAILVSEDPAHFQVLDPVTLRTVDLVRPTGMATPEPFFVLRHEEHLWIPSYLPAGFPPPPPPTKAPRNKR